MNKVLLFSLDFGTTTSRAMLVQAVVARNCINRQMELTDPQVLYASAPVFTPYVKHQHTICEQSIRSLVYDWLDEAGVRLDDIFSGGAIITGLAASSENSPKISALINDIIGDSFVSSVNDPCLESWLAFKSNAGCLSQLNADEVFLNLDIGGGTTNPAVGQAGHVLATGSYFIGARHFRFVPGTFQLLGLSPHAHFVLSQLGLDCDVGDALRDSDINAIVAYLAEQLLAIAEGAPLPTHLQQVELRLPRCERPPRILFSGGVGEILRRYLVTGKWPPRTCFGDLGGELACVLAKSTLCDFDYLSANLPKQGGRATVYGLALYNTEISGSTIYLSNEGLIPTSNLPLVGEIDEQSTDEQLSEIVALVYQCGGAGIYINASLSAPRELKQLALRLQPLLVRESQRSSVTALFLLPDNVAYTFGNYLSDWGRLSFPLLVIDEIGSRNASFINVGRLTHGVIPVSFYGMQQEPLVELIRTQSCSARQSGMTSQP